MSGFIYDKLSVGIRVQNRRMEMHYTQDQLAEMIDKSIRTITDIERGAVGMSLETLLGICDVLKTTPNELLLADIDTSDPDIIWLLNALSSSSDEVRKTAIELMRVYLRSVRVSEKHTT